MAHQLPRTGSFSGVWWKLGDDADEQRRLADEETAVKARIQRRNATARGVRRTIAFTSLTLEGAAFIYGLWIARRRRGGISNKTAAAKTATKLLLPVLVSVPAFAALLFAAFSRSHNFFDAKDQQKLDRLRAERNKAKMGHLRGSHHNMQKLLIHSTKESDPDSSAEPVATKTGHSRLSFHVGDDE